MNVELGRRAPPHDPAVLARAILTQPRFRMRVHATPAHTWWDSIRQWIGDRWNQLMDAFSRHVHVGGRWSIAAGDVLIAVLITLVIIIAVKLLLTMARDAAPGVHASALPVHADARKLQVAAIGAAERGAYAVAVALLFRAALAQLDARGMLRDDPARTVNECRSDVYRRARGLSAPFDRIARVFTAAVYAEDRMTLAQWSDAQDAYAAFDALQSDAA